MAALFTKPGCRQSSLSLLDSQFNSKAPQHEPRNRPLFERIPLR